MAVNFTKNQDEIAKAWRQVVDSKDTQNWALFGYEGNTNNIKLMSTGSNGLKGLVQEFNCSLIQYAFCRVLDKELCVDKLVLINWQGDSSPLSRKGLCASHVGDVADYFKGCALTITIRNDDEATQEYLMDQIVKASSSKVSLLSRLQQSGNSTTSINDTPDNVGSTYKKTDISSEISMDRKSFWQRQEEEEKGRQLEEKKRAAEKQAQFERERKLREESEAKKLAETIKERDRIIEATRQAENRRVSTGSQPSSIVSTHNDNDDDERVGRRSELIRLERNQETQSLISKGLIKNKRAIFEQASQQQQQSQQPIGSNLVRRVSGTMVTNRLNAFKSLDGAGGSSGGNSGLEKLTNGFAKHVNLDGGENDKSRAAPIKKEVETIKVTDDAQQLNSSSSQALSSAKTTTTPAAVAAQIDESLKANQAPIVNAAKEELLLSHNGNGNFDSIATENTNGSTNNNNISYKPCKSPKQEPKTDEASVFMNGKLNIRAKALYDYQAADHTEISFDPDDVISFIEKVDSGWWHGSVVTGKYQGQSGLFPANYVQEL